MIVVHHLEKSRSQRVLWLLEELGLPYEVKRYSRDPKTLLAPPELRAIHPLGKSPILVDGDVVIAESGAIIEYLLERHASALLPKPGTSERMRYTYFMHYAEGSAMPPLLLKLVFERLKQAPVPFFVRPILKTMSNNVLTTFVHPQLQLHAEYINSHLEKFMWFAGDEMSGADIQMSFPVEAMMARGGAKFPHLSRFLDRIHARPAYIRALEKGGPFSIL